ncbi:Acid phosphatase surE [Giardia duodenalis]|uniref:Acid phosphatase surE n=1 Tax=Giardia intestinalis (strain ATCC 50803 / WB clone C6) TaxID=184922 RepID=A0A644F4I4_GIAIC|nr:Acid phosphatase surE [Giardia intestinalis]KAE8303515.1 Acid phosphatase surE [Giardia intestinalis]
MRILLTNDDGHNFIGLTTLRQIMLDSGHTVIVAAPAHDQSGKSQSLHYIKELNVSRVAHGYVIEGSPVDCVRLGLQLHPDVELVVAGINNGANCGSDVCHSGTVGACFEAANMGYHAISYSMDTRGMPGDCLHHHEEGMCMLSNCKEPVQTTLDAYISYLAQNGSKRQRYTRLGMVWNVNIPAPHVPVLGCKAAVLGHRYYSVKYAYSIPIDLLNSSSSWTMRGELDPDSLPNRGVPSTIEADFDAVEKGWVTVTPLNPDRFHTDEYDSVLRVLSNLGPKRPPTLKGTIVCTNNPSCSIPDGSQLSLKLVDARRMDVPYIMLYEYTTTISGQFPFTIEFPCPQLDWDFDPSISVRISYLGSLICINDTHLAAPLHTILAGSLPTIEVVKVK